MPEKPKSTLETLHASSVTGARCLAYIVWWLPRANHCLLKQSISEILGRGTNVMRGEMTEYARLPRGWLYGVLLTILVFWFSGVSWEAFRNQELTTIAWAGALVMQLSQSVHAYQALTNDGYKTSKATLISKRVFFLGVVLFIVGHHI